MNYLNPLFWTLFCLFSSIYTAFVSVIALVEIYPYKDFTVMIAVTSWVSLSLFSIAWVIEYDKEHEEPKWIPVNKPIPQGKRRKKASYSQLTCEPMK